MTKPYKWRTIDAKCNYVDSATGSDLYGDGTMNNPYQSLGRAWRSSTTKKSIVCRGTFSENMEDGDAKSYINGDYLGAATFDGVGDYVIFGFAHHNMTFKNVHQIIPKSNYIGIGRSIREVDIGLSSSPRGLGERNMVDNSFLYMGCIGGALNETKYLVYSRLLANGEHLISINGIINNTISGAIVNNTIYSCRIANRMRNIAAKIFWCRNSILADFDLFADDAGIFLACLFAADCGWYYADQLEVGKPQLQIIVDNSTLTEPTFTADLANGTMTVGGVSDIPAAIDALFAAGRMTEKVTITDCVFTEQTSEQIFNNVEKDDFTLNPNGAGVINENTYYGALPPALAIPIMNDSTGVAGTWDENTAQGLIQVANNEICFDETIGAKRGSILSKIVQINPERISVSAIFSEFASKFNDFGCALWSEDMLGTTYNAGEILPIGTYVVNGAIIHEGSNFRNEVMKVVNENTTFENDGITSTVSELLDNNVSDVVYVRVSPIVYATLKQGDGLQRGGVYLNNGNSPITYRNRTIAVNESFVAANDSDDFTGPTADYSIAIMFDDTRVPSSEWIPSQLFGEYFAVKANGVTQLDNDGIPVGSGNYLAYQTPANGGYSNLVRMPLKQRYIQFKFEIQKAFITYENNL